MKGFEFLILFHIQNNQCIPSSMFGYGDFLDMEK